MANLVKTAEYLWGLGQRRPAVDLLFLAVGEHDSREALTRLAAPSATRPRREDDEDPEDLVILLLVSPRRSLGAGAGVDVAAVAGVAAKVSTSDGVGRLLSELLAHCEVTFR
eukprot:jgi/Tetstr1/461299/TSEL_006426.t1